jgi:3-deoxy-D-manno-octulosonic-acid transferase
MIGVRRRPFSLRAYRAATGLGASLARPLLEARARRGKEDPARLGERLGHASAQRPDGGLVCVSVLPLIARLAAERPDLAFLVTTGTRASAEIMARRLPSGAIHQYAPVDTPDAVARFLGHWRPDVGLFAESELWPNLILGAREAGARLALVSARMTDKSARAWRGRPDAAGAILAAFDLILAQDAASARRLEVLGATVAGQLNLKRVGAPLGVDADELARLRRAIGDRPVVVAASTHATEEALIAEATGSVGGRILTILVPRHPERAAQIERDLAGRRVARRSTGEPIDATTEIYLADTLSELGLFLRLADVVVMGGGFARGVGGHNPIEAARLGRGVISGPQVFNHADAFAEMTTCGAALLVDDAPALAAALRRLLDDPGRRAAFDAAALAFADRQGGELDAALALVRPLLPPV